MAATVVTAVVFSATVTDVAAAPPPLVMTGVRSFTGFTVTAIAWVSLRLPSLTCTVMS